MSCAKQEATMKLFVYVEPKWFGPHMLIHPYINQKNSLAPSDAI